MHKSSIRLAKHAGTWYPATKNALQKDMDQYFEKINKQIIVSPQNIKALIGPHAGYKFCGHVSAWAYQYFQKHPSTPARIFLLGPSHHQYFEGLSLSSMESLDTPLGSLKVDTQCIKELKIIEKARVKVAQSGDAPSNDQEDIQKLRVIDQDIAAKYGKVLSEYFDGENTIFIISTDFCHWGPHFAYQPFSQGKQIHQYIDEIDHQGMRLIQKNDSKGFDQYIAKTGNTICGQFPLRILMHIINSSKNKNLQTKFVQYDQSDKVKSFNGSSVSYASAVVYQK